MPMPIAGSLQQGRQLEIPGRARQFLGRSLARYDTRVYHPLGYVFRGARPNHICRQQYRLWVQLWFFLYRTVTLDRYFTYLRWNSDSHIAISKSWSSLTARQLTVRAFSRRFERIALVDVTMKIPIIQWR